MDQKHQKMSKAVQIYKMSYLSKGMMRYIHNRSKTNKPAKYPHQRDKCCEIFLSPLTVRVIQKLTVQNIIR